MSQQINLLLDELRPRRDWLALPTVALGSGALAGLTLLWGLLTAVHNLSLEQERRALDKQRETLQQRTTQLSTQMSERKPDPVLLREIDAQTVALQQRKEAIAVLESGAVGNSTGFSSLLSGLARQVTDGVWLTAFRFQGKDIEISGRLMDQALLPTYIRKLNSEAAFQGRQFAALDMKGIRQQSAATPSTAAPALPAPSRPPLASPPETTEGGPLKHIEFTLSGQLPSADKKAEGAP